ncbi:MAG: hypothetical protein ABSE58_03620 [Candidatus Limnocylindrales bacterium]|jgi:hypothetical protein
MDGYDDDLPPAEVAREKRRDRDADAAARAGMRTGLAKQFKQVLDSQRKRAEDDDRAAGGDASRPERGAGKPRTSPRKK